jgi:hypothetical protein
MQESTNSKIPLFKFVIEDEFNVEEIAIVKNPAIKESFIALSEKNNSNLINVNLKEFKSIDDKKGILFGPILVPDRPLPQFSEDIGFYNGIFSKEDVEKLYLKSLENPPKWNLNHDRAMQIECDFGTSFIDKGNPSFAEAFDFNTNPGTWFGTVKVTDPNLFQEIVNGSATGFSIEVRTRLEPFQISDENVKLDDKTLNSDENVKLKEKALNDDNKVDELSEDELIDIKKKELFKMKKNELINLIKMKLIELENSKKISREKVSFYAMNLFQKEPYLSKFVKSNEDRIFKDLFEESIKLEINS